MKNAEPLATTDRKGWHALELRFLACTLCYLATIWSCLILFEYAGAILNLPFVKKLPAYIVQPKLLLTSTVIILITFAAGRRYDRPFPGRWSWCAYVLCTILTFISLQSYLVDTTQVPDWFLTWLQVTRSLPAFAFTGLFLSIVNLLGLVRLPFATKGIRAVLQEKHENPAMITFTRLLFILSSLFVFTISQQSYYVPRKVHSWMFDHFLFMIVVVSYGWFWGREPGVYVNPFMRYVWWNIASYGYTFTSSLFYWSDSYVMGSWWRMFVHFVAFSGIGVLAIFVGFAGSLGIKLGKQSSQ